MGDKLRDKINDRKVKLLKEMKEKREREEREKLAAYTSSNAKQKEKQYRKEIMNVQLWFLVSIQIILHKD